MIRSSSDDICNGHDVSWRMSISANRSRRQDCPFRYRPSIRAAYGSGSIMRALNVAEPAFKVALESRENRRRPQLRASCANAACALLLYIFLRIFLMLFSSRGVGDKSVYRAACSERPAGTTSREHHYVIICSSSGGRAAAPYPTDAQRHRQATGRARAFLPANGACRAAHAPVGARLAASGGGSARRNNLRGWPCSVPLSATAPTWCMRAVGVPAGAEPRAIHRNGAWPPSSRSLRARLSYPQRARHFGEGLREEGDLEISSGLKWPTHIDALHGFIAGRRRVFSDDACVWHICHAA